jgi:hypothetical protein
MFLLLSHIALKLVVGNFVSFLEFAVIGQVFLNCIIGEVNFTTISFQIIFRRGCSNIALSIEISLHLTVHASYHHIVPNVKFSLLIEQRFFDVILNNKRFWRTISIFLLFFNNIFYFLKSQTDLNTITSVRILSWLDYPSVVLLCWFISQN